MPRNFLSSTKLPLPCTRRVSSRRFIGWPIYLPGVAWPFSPLVLAGLRGGRVSGVFFFVTRIYLVLFALIQPFTTAPFATNQSASEYFSLPAAPAIRRPAKEAVPQSAIRLSRSLSCRLH